MVHDSMVGTEIEVEICPPSTGTGTIEISQKFQFSKFEAN